MAKQKYRINLFDLLVIFLVIITALIGFIAYNNKPSLGERTLIVDVRISNIETIEAILPTIKTASEVYYSSSKYPVKQLSYDVEKDVSGQIKYLNIKIEGPGLISDGKSIFNGQRIFTNQKVELRADYFAQGYVTGFGYAD